MKIVIGLVGLVDQRQTLAWPQGWSVPRVGEHVSVPSVGRMMVVRSVTWYPKGNDHVSEPFVYVVVGLSRPQ